MTLFKTSILNGMAVVVKIASALVLNKILAVYVGPAGYAILGQFQNAVSIVVNLAGGIVATGVTKATAQHFDDEAKQHAVWQTAIRFSMVASLIAALIVWLLGDTLSAYLLHRPDMSGVFAWLALALPAMAINNLLLAIINGKKELGIYVMANILGSLISLAVIGLLAYSFGLYGALVAFTINPAIVLLATAGMVSRRSWFKAKFLWGSINPHALRELTGFGLMGLTSAICAPVSYMLMRDHLSTNLGLTAAGCWQASWKISELYLMLVTTTLSVYYLPRLAEIRSGAELKREIFRVYSFVMPIAITSASTIYLLRDFIIHTLFTPNFAPMRDLFAWQLTGDVIKIGSWVLAFIMLGRAMIKVFIATEIIFSISFVLLNQFLTEQYGLTGSPIAYCLTYSFYWAFLGYNIHQEIKRMGKT